MRDIYYILLSFFFCGLVACQEEKTGEEPVGRIRLNLTDQVETKALPDALTPELTDQFLVRMIRKTDDRLVFRGTCADFNTKAQLFKAGEHSLQASYGDNPAIGMDAPYYVSEEKTITVEGGKEQQVTLQCKVGNALAAFEFVNADKLGKVLKDYYIEVVVKGESVKWYPGSGENPYFKAGSKVTFYLKGTWIENGLPYAGDFATIQPVEAGKMYRYKLKFDTSNMTGAIMDIEVDAAVENVTVNQTLPPAWLPKPKIAADGFDAENILTYTETADAMTAEINFAAIRPVQEVEMTLNFADPNLSGLNKTYVFSSMTAEEKEKLQQAAIILPALDETTTSGKINFSAMTTSLLTLNGGLEADNQIRLRVKANDRWSDEVSYTIKTVKPEFTVGAYPGNIWTKEFTINPLTADSVKTGNINRFQNIVYEFSLDGIGWEQFPDDLRKTELIPGTEYYVRAKYRGQVPGETCKICTYPVILLDNGSMEEWYEQDGDGHYNLWYPYVSGSGSPMWNTKNMETTVNQNSTYCSTSGTVRTGDKYSGSYAALIRTVGYGVGNTYAGSLSIVYNEAVGELYLGNYNGGAQYGIPYQSHPTKVRFYYKYLPYETDHGICEISIDNAERGVNLFKTSVDLPAQSGYVEKVIDFTFSDITVEATQLSIVFKSGTKTDIKKAQKRDGIKEHFGSQLFVDDVELFYEK